MSRERHLSQHSIPASGWPVWTELIIYLVALLAAFASGVAAYERFGPYGDGPFGAGFRRVIDSQTGRSILVRDVVSGTSRRRMAYDPNPARMSRGGASVTTVEIDANADGIIDVWEYYDLAQNLEKRGFSLSQDGTLDAWAYYDQDGELLRIEVSSAGDGTVDRWEHYDAGRLARVELDTNGDNEPDTLHTYADGLLIDTVTPDAK